MTAESEIESVRKIAQAEKSRADELYKTLIEIKEYADYTLHEDRELTTKEKRLLEFITGKIEI